MGKQDGSIGGGGELVYYVAPELVTPDAITTDTAIGATGDGHMSTLLDDEPIGVFGLRGEGDFVTQWTGGFFATFSATGSMIVRLHTKHANARHSFDHIRESTEFVVQNNPIHFMMSAFNRYSDLGLRTYETSGALVADADVEVTPQDLAEPIRITYEVELQFAQLNGTRAAGTLKSLRWDPPQTRSWQVRYWKQ